jgi:hypothetical protein
MEAVAGAAANEAEAAVMRRDSLGALDDLPVSIEGLVTAKSEHRTEGVRDGTLG